MLDRLLHFFIHRKLLINLIIITLILAGFFSLSSLRRESMPEVDLYKITYSTIYPGASPNDVELQVTIPLEDAIKEVDDIKEFSSISYENMSYITITLEDYLTDEEAEDVKTDIQKAIDTVNLPSDIKQQPEAFEVKTSKLPIIEAALSHPNYKELRKIARYLENKIEKLPQVSKVYKIGYLDREIRIELDPKKLIKTETPVDDVINSLKGTSIRLSGGKFKKYEDEKNIVIDEEFKDDRLIQYSIIRATFGNKILRIKDVGSVREGFEDPNTIIRFNGISGISLQVVKNQKADAIRTIQKVKSLIEKEQPKLASELRVDLINDTSIYTKNRIKIVILNALIGLVLVMLSLKIFLDFRTAAWTAFGIPFSLIVSFTVLRFLNVSINPISLGGFIIVIGMLVDDAIVVAENIKRHIEEKDSIREAVKHGVSEVAIPVITTITTTIIAFLPLMFVPGIMGKFMKIMPIVVIITLLASLVESLFILPSHLDHKKKLNKSYKKKEWVKKLESKYKKLLAKIVRIRYLFFSLGFAIFIFSIVFAVTAMKFELFPSADADAFTIKLEASDNTSLEKMSDLVNYVEKAVNKIPKTEISSYKAVIGQESDISFGSNLAYVSVFLTPSEKRTMELRQLYTKIREQLGIHQKSFYRITFETERHGPPIGKPIDVSLVSDNDIQKEAAGTELLNYIKSISGVIDPKDSKGENVLEYRIAINKEKIAQFGLNVLNIANTVRTAYEGNKVFELRRDNEDVQYKVIFTEKDRQNKKLLLNLPVRNNQGQLVRLNKFATLTEEDSVLKSIRYNGQSSYSVFAELDTTKTTSMEATAKIKNFFKEKLQEKYPAVDIIVSGEATMSQDSLVALGHSFIIAIVGIYFMLILLFNSVVQPIFVLSAVPFALIGVIWAFYFHDQAFSFPAMMGIIGLTGVVVNDSLIMVNYINSIIKESDKKQEFVEHVLSGATTRLRPIILTTVTTVLGLLPTIYGWGGTDFILVPMTMSLGYGLAFATVITLFFVPCLTVIYYDVKHLFKKT